MNPNEFGVMAELEHDHWWYQGLRQAIADAVDRFALPSHQPISIVDAGCGTGENLKFLASRYPCRYLGGFDPSTAAIEVARKKANSAEIYASDICAPIIRIDEIDVLLSCDVINIPGIERCRPGLVMLVKHLAPQGLFVLNLPAYRWLASEHDRAVHTTERYRAAEIRQLLEDLGLHIELLTYRLFFLFPMVVVSRLPSMFQGSTVGPNRSRSQLVKHVDLVNHSLAAVMRMENWFIRMGVRFPLGSSLFVVARKVP